MSFLPNYCPSLSIIVIPSELLSFLSNYCHSFRIIVIPSKILSFLWDCLLVFRNLLAPATAKGRENWPPEMATFASLYKILTYNLHTKIKINLQLVVGLVKAWIEKSGCLWKYNSTWCCWGFVSNNDLICHISAKNTSEKCLNSFQSTHWIQNKSGFQIAQQFICMFANTFV